MCLKQITKKHDKPLKLSEPIIGWKVFEVHQRNGQILNIYRCILNTPKVVFEKDVWVDDEYNMYIHNSKKDSKYKCGFHLFSRKEDAEEFASRQTESHNYYTNIYKVKCDNITAEGIDESGFHTIVARSLKICV